jgi:predicted restriction endonuclease
MQPVEKPKAKRTDRQNRALHLFFRMVADELNAGGYDVQIVLKEKLGVDWTPALVKEILWKTAQRWILQKKSTTELNKSEDITKIYEHLNRHISEKFGVHIPFPHFENEKDYLEETLTTSL